MKPSLFRGMLLAAAALACLPAGAAAATHKTGHAAADPEQNERAVRVAAAQAQVRALQRHAGEVIARATRPEDLDALLVEMRSPAPDSEGFPDAADAATPELAAAAFAFVKQWQDYLAHVQAGQADLVRSDLLNLSQDNDAIGIVPRSKILALLAAPPPSPADAGGPQVRAILAGIRTLDDLAPALDKLEALKSDAPSVRAASNTLAAMNNAYASLKAGLPVNQGQGFPDVAGWARISPVADALLLKLNLQHAFDTYTGSAPTPEETPSAYVARVQADALSRQDWPLLQKALAARGFLAGSVDPRAGPSNAAAGMDSVIVAGNLEAAQQVALAVVAYQMALRSANPDLPTKFIGERLAALQRDHPREFAEGQQRFAETSAPRTPYAAFPGGARPPPGFTPPPGFPGLASPTVPVAPDPAAKPASKP
ncbi:MAG: hypothetical protein WDO13_01890 [Verrucomicrobiota bacterium]